MENIVEIGKPLRYTQAQIEDIMEFADIKKCRDAFDLFDKNNDGRID